MPWKQIKTKLKRLILWYSRMFGTPFLPVFITTFWHSLRTRWSGLSKGWGLRAPWRSTRWWGISWGWGTGIHGIFSWMKRQVANRFLFPYSSNHGRKWFGLGAKLLIAFLRTAHSLLLFLTVRFCSLLYRRGRPYWSRCRLWYGKVYFSLPFYLANSQSPLSFLW